MFTIIIIIIILIIFIINVDNLDLLSENNDNNSNNIIELKWCYIADIYYNGTENYTLYLPIITSDPYDSLAKNMTRWYYWLFEMNDTEYGQAFIINWNSSMYISSGNFEAEHVELSFEEQIFSSFNSSNSRLSVHIELMCTNGEGYEIFTTDLNGEGWEPVEIEYHSPPID
jgi:hypothetical protein